VSVFLTMFLLQAVIFMVLSRVESFGALAVLAFVVLLCYGAASAPCRPSLPIRSVRPMSDRSTV
jgi:hypothetical protein